MIAFAFVAGVLSILSPCVLPLVPVVLGSAISEHTYGPVALSVGVALSFTIIGLFVATIGFAAGIDADIVQRVAAVMLVLIGIVLLVPALQMRITIAAGPVGSLAQERFGTFSSRGLAGQFGVGLLLGAIWSPCVGPALGAASLMASRSEHLWLVALTMLAYGMGAGLPMMILGFISRDTFLRWRGSMITAGKGLKQAMGALLLVLGVLMIAGLDKVVETKLVDASPAWLTTLTTRF